MKLEEAIKQKKFESAQHKAMLNLIYTFNWFSGIQAQSLKAFDLTPQQYNVLRILRGRYPNSVPAGEVKEVMLDKNPDLTRLCDRLLTKKLIARETNAFNRRQVLVKISKAGLELLKKVDPAIKGFTRKNLQLSDGEANQISDLMDKMRG